MPCSAGGQKAIFVKKCIFRAENDIFSKSSFYAKMISDPQYSFSVSQKHFFVIQSKVKIFHQIQPSHETSGWWWVAIEFSVSSRKRLKF